MQNSTFVRDIMVRRVITVHPDDRVAEAVRTLVEHNISGAPVMDSDRLYQGVFAEKSCMGVLSLAARAIGTYGLKAGDIMQTRLVTLSGDSDVFEGIAKLLHYRVSGAPVISSTGEFRGVFSEKDSMSVVVSSAYDQMPTSRVQSFMNPDPHRAVARDTDLMSLISIFQSTHYRRLIVLEGNHVIGLISRRDVVKAALPLLERVAAEQAAARESSEAFVGGLDEEFAIASTTAFMDLNARTICEDQDVLAVANLFLNTNYRRLPVLRKRELIGLVSRRNLLEHLMNSLAVPKAPPHHPLYTSCLIDPDASIPIE